ncbi:MAG: carbonic anhydrase, partial [Candidatus Melainabacteria bacterium]|nr:carbonic anhydrase [Candidatus Melainabacteria bacterium]
MQKLIKGIHHFTNEIFASKKELFELLALGQYPEVLFITCSDARVDPQLITQAEPGDLFMLRNMGNLVPDCRAEEKVAGAAIEYALKVLRVRQIVVCGHSHCGAMKGIVDPDLLQDLPAVADWLKHAEQTRRILMSNYQTLDNAQLLNIATQENVLVQLENLRSYPAVAAAINKGELVVQGWVYKIETGEIFIYHPENSQF